MPAAAHPLRLAALGAIRLYQRFISPHKGFGCAYRLHTGGASCSTLAYRAIRRHGLFTGLALLDQRLDRCGEAHRRHGQEAARRLGPQAGLCDLSCDAPCDLDGGGHGLPRGMSNCASAACDCTNCASCDCGDWRRRGDTSRPRKKRDREKWVRIPPSSPHRRPK